eukprot:gene12366-2256_t
MDGRGSYITTRIYTSPSIHWSASWKPPPDSGSPIEGALMSAMNGRPGALADLLANTTPEQLAPSQPHGAAPSKRVTGAVYLPADAKVKPHQEPVIQVVHSTPQAASPTQARRNQWFKCNQQQGRAGTGCPDAKRRQDAALVGMPQRPALARTAQGARQGDSITFQPIVDEFAPRPQCSGGVCVLMDAHYQCLAMGSFPPQRELDTLADASRRKYRCGKWTPGAVTIWDTVAEKQDILTGVAFVSIPCVLMISEAKTCSHPSQGSPKAHCKQVQWKVEWVGRVPLNLNAAWQNVVVIRV